MSAKSHGIQFWDTSAIVSLIAQERHTPVSMKARRDGLHFLAWNWMQVESYSALVRRRLGHEEFQMLKGILSVFDYIGIEAKEYPALNKTVQKHRLRSADGGHLFCLKQAKKLHPEITFVCFDDELAKAAELEGIRVFS